MNERIENYKNLILQKLNENSMIWNHSGILRDSMNYTLLNSGKLARSVIILLGLDNLNFEYSLGLDVATALEMIQSYSLIHDDLPEMDNAKYRRGKLANHLIYGHGQALLSGDALLTESFRILANANLSSEQKLKLIELFSKKAGTNGVCYGQSLDIINEAKPFDKWSEVEEVIKHKTCALFEIAFMSIGIIASLDDFSIDILEQIGYDFGLAFQIKDDLNDELSTLDVIGKDASQDVYKNTYHKIYGIDKAKDKINELLNNVSNNIKKVFNDDSIYDYLKNIIK